MSKPNPTAPESPLRLGIEGFTFPDLYTPEGLARLTDAFDTILEKREPELAKQLFAYRAAGGAGLSKPVESDLLIAAGRYLSDFVARLFGVEAEREALARTLGAERPLFELRRDFITRRVFKKGAKDRPVAEELPALERQARALLCAGFDVDWDAAEDRERTFAEVVLVLMEMERLFGGQLEKTEEGLARVPAVRARWSDLRGRLLATVDAAGADEEPPFDEELRAALGAPGADGAEAEVSQEAVRALLKLVDRWTYARSLDPEGRAEQASWPSHRIPHPLTFDNLVPVHRPDHALPEAAEALPSNLRPRDGFKLTDRRAGPRAVMGEIDYCILCHMREKDSCSHGFKAKDPAAEGHTYKKNALNIPLTGCPLDERISEAHTLKGEGDSLAALAVITLDNPMVAGTGHRICNDCMKACIYQKQEPVDIPQAETSILTDVLALPYGFEIYALLARWNPLDARRPSPVPCNGKNVLVVGMGPAGYTLAHYLLNQGFAVVGIDGLKIEPFPDELTGRNGHALTPIRDFSTLTAELDRRVLAGFGGVSEYGITVRWDKNFLTLMHLMLARRPGFRAYGGVRFGGTLTLEEAWSLGFDHVAIAAGAGSPTVVPMRNNLIRGVRKASDFLMALQLTGAFRQGSLANLQIRLPAVVIGGGLTAVDTATELMAFYPVQVERVLERHERLVEQLGEREVRARLDDEEREVLDTFLEHGRAVRDERARAKNEGRAPDFISLVRAWGGVSICYRRGLNESPAYRLNHEEVTKALEEGIRFIERVSPVEAVPDEHGAVKALRFERMAVAEDGRLRASGEPLELEARCVCVAAGTSPNVSYEKEHPGTFELDDRRQYLRGYRIEHDDHGKPALLPVVPKQDLDAEVGFFTSYRDEAGRLVTFYGDNHPTYAGNVVKAMASAKDGYPEVVRLFFEELSKLDLYEDEGRKVRQAARAALFERIDEALMPRVHAVRRLTPTIVEVVIKAPLAARHFEPGQFYRLQNYERFAPTVDGAPLLMEGLALTGAWVDREEGLLSTIVLEMGASSRLCAYLREGEPVVLMGPTGTPTEIPEGETVLLAGGGLGNAVLFSIARALKLAGCRVVYFAAFKKASDAYKRDEIEAATDQVIWSVDEGPLLEARRPQDASFEGNVVQAMTAWAREELAQPPAFPMKEVDRIIAIGSDRMMAAVKSARHGVLAPYLTPGHQAIGSINSPMQCMMKEICAQCLQKHVDPVTGEETLVFSCSNQDQPLDRVDFGHLASRLKLNGVLEKQTDLWLRHLLTQAKDLDHV